MNHRDRIVVIGAGIGGLTAAALLAKAGLDVTVLEAHVYPGGCAGTFYHQGYRFDAGATLAGGFYPGGPMDGVAAAAGIDAWPAQRADPAMLVHLPDGATVPRFGDERRHDAHRDAFGPAAEPFFRWQERTADALWDLALRSPPWPPQSPRELVRLAGDGARWLLHHPAHHLDPRLLADAFRPVASHLPGATHLVGASHLKGTSHLKGALRLRQFVDAQLLIAAQTTSAQANALYGASALDLPRRGVVHLAGGMGAIAETLAAAVRRHGGRVLQRQEVVRVVTEGGRPAAVETKHGERYPAGAVIANLPPWNIARLLGDAAPPALQKLPPQPTDGWGAFMVYVGLDTAAVPAGAPLHHQVIVREPMGEGNTVFLSLSPEWDAGRAPAGRRSLTISTHTDLAPWWRLHKHDSARYEARKEAYAQRILAAAERALPGLAAAADLVLPGTPVTFQRFTRRDWGWVGGFPQTSLFRTWAPRLAPGLWMVGDSIFPGQSTAAVALGGLRVANSLLAELGVPSALTLAEQRAPLLPPVSP